MVERKKVKDADEKLKDAEKAFAWMLLRFGMAGALIVIVIIIVVTIIVFCLYRILIWGMYLIILSL